MQSSTFRFSVSTLCIKYTVSIESVIALHNFSISTLYATILLCLSLTNGQKHDFGYR